MSASEQARALMIRHHHLVRNRQRSLLGRAAAEVGLPDVSSYNGTIQGKPLSSFQNSYDRSHASLS